MICLTPWDLRNQLAGWAVNFMKLAEAMWLIVQVP